MRCSSRIWFRLPLGDAGYRRRRRAGWWALWSQKEQRASLPDPPVREASPKKGMCLGTVLDVGRRSLHVLKQALPGHGARCGKTLTACSS